MKLDELRDSSDEFPLGSLVYWDIIGEDSWMIGPMLVIGRLPVGSGHQFLLWDPRTDEQFYVRPCELCHFGEVEESSVIET